LDHNVYDASPGQRVFVINSACDTPSPWSPTEFLKLIHRDLGASSPGVQAMNGEAKALLTLEEWQSFWQKHGLANDQHSVLHAGMSVSYDPESHEVTMAIPFDPSRLGSTDHEFMDNDFWGDTVPQNGRALPGPFQNLEQGENVFCVWNGLPVIEAGELPGK
jgi:hypothetical protein